MSSLKYFGGVTYTMTRRTDKQIGRELLHGVKCLRCSFVSNHRDKTLKHAEKAHGDYSSLRTRDEYMAFLKSRGEPLERLKLAEYMPVNRFLTKTALKKLKRRGQA